jgi:hypothetical protein
MSYFLIRAQPGLKFCSFPVDFRPEISRIRLPYNNLHRKHCRKFFLGCNLEIKLKNESLFNFISPLSASRLPFSWPSGNWD